jgi:hypothetical protein
VSHTYNFSKVEELAFIINGQLDPRAPYKIKNSDGESRYARLFAQLHHSLMLHQENESTCVLYDTFMSQQFFVSHDLTAYSSALSSVNEPFEPSSVGVQLQFSEGTKEPLLVILYALCPRRFEITSQRSVHVKY